MAARTPGSSSVSCCCNGSVGLNWHICIFYVEVWELQLYFYPIRRRIKIIIKMSDGLSVIKRNGWYWVLSWYNGWYWVFSRYNGFCWIFSRYNRLIFWVFSRCNGWYFLGGILAMQWLTLGSCAVKEPLPHKPKRKCNGWTTALYSLLNRGKCRTSLGKPSTFFFFFFFFFSSHLFSSPLFFLSLLFE